MNDEYGLPPFKYTPTYCYRYDYNLIGIDPEVPLAFPQDEYEDQCRLDEMYFNSISRANQSQSPDRGADVFSDDEPLSPEIPIRYTPVEPPPAPVKPPPPPVKPVPPVPGPVLTRRVRKRNLPKPVVSKEARIKLDERRRRRLENPH